jgi:hypothetical protein
MYSRIIASVIVMMMYIALASAQTSCLVRDQTALLNELSSCADQGGPPGCLTPDKIRDLICSVPVFQGSDFRLYVGPKTDWVNSFWPNTTLVTQLMASNISGGYGFIGASKTSNNANNDAIAVAGFASNDNVSAVPPVGAWGGYFEADRANGVNTPTVGAEIDVGNNGSIVDVNPFAMHPSALNVPLWMGCGGAGFNGVGGSQPCSLAIGVVPNTLPFRRGIAFQSDALDPSVGAGGRGMAMELAAGQSIKWSLNNSDHVAFEMWGSSAGLGAVCNSQTAPLSNPTTLSLCTNFSGGGGEVDIFNSQNNAEGFTFYQKTSSSTYRKIVTIPGTGGIRLPVTTVTALPSCDAGAEGTMYGVSDANSPAYNEALGTGGGNTHVIAYCNGSYWAAH